MPKILLVAILTLLLNFQIGFGDVVSVIATGPNANVETISQIVMEAELNGVTNIISQNAPETGVTESVDSAILQSVTISSGTLEFYNPDMPTISNAMFPGTAAGIELLENGGTTNVSDPNFLSDLANMHSNLDLVNYLRVDGTNSTPQWDVNYATPISSNDFLIVEERDGNTTFTVEALDINGNPIANSDSLSFDNESYQWSTGLSNSMDPFGRQPQVVSVIDFSLFNTTTPIAGFRIVNTGNADFKLFVATAVPEPSSTAVLGLLLFGTLARRKRKAQ